VPAGMLIGDALDALAMRAARGVADVRAPLGATVALVAAGWALALIAAVGGQGLAPRSPASLVGGLVALGRWRAT